MVKKGPAEEELHQEPMGPPLPTPEILAEACELLQRGFPVSALNRLMDNARQAARLIVAPAGTVERSLEESRSKVVEALEVAIIRLEENRVALLAAPLHPARPKKARGRRKKK
jgi:hypothetical protein